jgi:hypothetical protein
LKLHSSTPNETARLSRSLQESAQIHP